MAHLGHIYANGIMVAQSNETALAWFWKAAEKSELYCNTTCWAGGRAGGWRGVEGVWSCGAGLLGAWKWRLLAGGGGGGGEGAPSLWAGQLGLWRAGRPAACLVALPREGQP